MDAANASKTRADACVGVWVDVRCGRLTKHETQTAIWLIAHHVCVIATTHVHNGFCEQHACGAAA